MPRIRRHDLDHLDREEDLPPGHATGRARRREAAEPAAGEPPRPTRTRANEQRPFKCGRCRAFVGVPPSGGRHRNHCPLCLTSRHLDLRRPGDRCSPCRALMAPVGTAFKARGEQVVVHRCNGCGVERRTRVAADDNPLALLRLCPFAPRPGVEQAAEEAVA